MKVLISYQIDMNEKRNVLPSKLWPENFFLNIQNFSLKKKKTMGLRKNYKENIFYILHLCAKFQSSRSNNNLVFFYFIGIKKNV